MDGENELPEKFSDDAEEQLRIENEILKLKLQAELGGEMQSFEGMENLPPEMENMFLKNILSFEHQFESKEPVAVAELIGNPSVAKVGDIDDANMDEALGNLELLLQGNNIVIDYAKDYGAREKYRFITEDLFAHRTMPLEIPGMVIHFSYEEFYPDHKQIIEEQAKEFIAHWFGMDFSEYSWELSEELFTDDNRIFTKAEVLEKFARIFASYKTFDNCEYIITEVGFQLNDDGTGLGFAEGAIRSRAELENSEMIDLSGGFKLYLQLIDKDWAIFFFYWPGFVW